MQTLTRWARWPARHRKLRALADFAREVLFPIGRAGPPLSCIWEPQSQLACRASRYARTRPVEANRRKAVEEVQPPWDAARPRFTSGWGLLTQGASCPQAVEWCMFGCFWTNGQICSATSRLLIQESIGNNASPAGSLLLRWLGQDTGLFPPLPWPLCSACFLRAVAEQGPIHQDLRPAGRGLPNGTTGQP